MAKSFSDVLAGFCDAAKKTTIQERDRSGPPNGEYHLQMVKKLSEAKTNQYGAYVQTNLGFKILDPGDLQDREFTVVFLINTTKEGDLNFGGQNFVQLAGILAGEPIADNNPVTADSVVTAACDKGDVIRCRVFTRKNGYTGIEALSLETPIAA